MKTYQYKTLSTCYGLQSGVIEALNKLGAEGWRQKDILLDPDKKGSWTILLEKEIE